MRLITPILAGLILIGSVACNRYASVNTDPIKTSPSNAGCHVAEPAKAVEQWNAMETRNVEMMLDAWQGPKEPTAAQVATLYGEMGTATITHEYFGSCRMADGNTDSFYVVHLTGGNVTPTTGSLTGGNDVWYVITTDKDDHIVDMQ